jgi:hypothetical protein
MDKQQSSAGGVAYPSIRFADDQPTPRYWNLPLRRLAGSYSPILARSVPKSPESGKPRWSA